MRNTKRYRRKIRRRQSRNRKILYLAAAIVIAIAVFVGVKGIYSSINQKAFLVNASENDSGKMGKWGKTRRVLLDAGHGGDDPGCLLEGENPLNEKNINMEITLKLKAVLEERGYEVIMLREGDEKLRPEERAALANKSKADILISIHQNIIESDSITSGIETWYNDSANKSSKSLADSIQKGAVVHTGAKDHGTKESEELILTRETKIPSCIIETGFLSNKQERDKLLSDSYQTQLAEGIANGVDNYY